MAQTQPAAPAARPRPPAPPRPNVPTPRQAAPPLPPRATPPAYLPPPPAAASWPNPGRLRDNRGLARALFALVPLSVLAGFAALATQDHTLVLSREGGSANAFDAGNGWSLASSLVGLAAAVVGLVWVYRTAANAQAMAGSGRPSPGWALGSWFIPFANLVLPFFPLRDAWRASRAGGEGVLVGWWVAWGSSAALALVAGIASFGWGVRQGLLLDPGETRIVRIPGGILALQWVQQAFLLAAAVLFLLVIRRFLAAQAPQPRAA